MKRYVHFCGFGNHNTVNDEQYGTWEDWETNNPFHIPTIVYRRISGFHVDISCSVFASVFLEAMGVVVKFSYGDELRRVTLPEKHGKNCESYAAFVETVMNIFPSVRNSEIRLSWMDDEGEEITISTDVEVIDALRAMKKIPHFTVHSSTVAKIIEDTSIEDSAETANNFDKLSIQKTSTPLLTYSSENQCKMKEDFRVNWKELSNLVSKGLAHPSGTSPSTGENTAARISILLSEISAQINTLFLGSRVAAEMPTIDPSTQQAEMFADERAGVPSTVSPNQLPLQSLESQPPPIPLSQSLLTVDDRVPRARDSKLRDSVGEPLSRSWSEWKERHNIK